MGAAASRRFTSAMPVQSVRTPLPSREQIEMLQARRAVEILRWRDKGTVASRRFISAVAVHGVRVPSPWLSHIAREQIEAKHEVTVLKWRNMGAVKKRAVTALSRSNMGAVTYRRFMSDVVLHSARALLPSNSVREQIQKEGKDRLRQERKGTGDKRKEEIPLSNLNSQQSGGLSVSCSYMEQDDADASDVKQSKSSGVQLQDVEEEVKPQDSFGSVLIKPQDSFGSVLIKPQDSLRSQLIKTHGGCEWERYTYEVFMSFRGRDVRRGFVDHLYQALKSEGLRIFLDSHNIKRGEDIAASLHNAIDVSRILIPVFSTNYAESVWCLREASLIARQVLLQRQGIGSAIAIPLFYDVTPRQVRRPEQCGGPFAEAFEKHESSGRYSIEDIGEWKAALFELCRLSGWSLKEDFNGYEATLVKRVVKEVAELCNTDPRSSPSV